jgi:hypothetical protein
MGKVAKGFIRLLSNTDVLIRRMETLSSDLNI